MAVSSEGSGRTNERSSPQRATSTGPPASCSLPLMSCGVHVCKSGNDLEVERLRPGVHVCEDFVARIGDPPERSTGVEGSKLNLFSTSEERQLKLLRLRCLHVRGSPATHTMAADAATAHGSYPKSSSCPGRARVSTPAARTGAWSNNCSHSAHTRGTACLNGVRGRSL